MVHGAKFGATLQLIRTIAGDQGNCLGVGPGQDGDNAAFFLPVRSSLHHRPALTRAGPVMHHSAIDSPSITCVADSPEQTAEIAAEFARSLGRGSVVLLHGPLGAGKTTFVRGILAGLGHKSTVRSPTFNLIQTFETDPPVMHADLYRVTNHLGIGLEDYLGDYVCLIEWADRAVGLVDASECWSVTIGFAGEGREITVHPPRGS